jgi:hypothetical protein
MQYLTALLLCLAPVSLALPVESSPVENAIEVRQSSVTCGSTTYSSSQLSAARSAACNYVQDGDTAGSSTYPHQYNNYEGFDFPVSGPYYEFPILRSGVYTGGKFANMNPGADAVLIWSRIPRCGPCCHQRQLPEGWRDYAHWCEWKRLCWMLWNELIGSFRFWSWGT